MDQNQTATSSNTTGAQAQQTSMEVSGEALVCFPAFILQKFGKAKYHLWLNTLPAESRQIYSHPIDKHAWYPLQDAITEPTIGICNMFYNKSIRGAWECGRNSADYGLRGIKKILTKLSSPQLLIQKATIIIQDYYRPSNLAVVTQEDYLIVIRITEFPQINRYIEHRIAGWMERALQICGSKHVTIQITASMSDKDPFTEFKITWKKY